jgi:hypothetical protein
MLDPGPSDGGWSGAPDLHEQVSTARDRLAEFVLVVVGISAGLGLVSNLLVGLLHDGALTQPEWLALLLGSALTLALALAAAARLRISTRELDEEIELAVPLLVPQGNSDLAVDLIEVAPYAEVTELGHAAVARLPDEQGAALARAAASSMATCASRRRGNIPTSIPLKPASLTRTRYHSPLGVVFAARWSMAASVFGEVPLDNEQKCAEADVIIFSL